jgi:hypothetical protein
MIGSAGKETTMPTATIEQAKPFDAVDLTANDRVVAAMREWLSDIVWRDLDPAEGDLDAVADNQIIRAVARHYDGGVRGFCSDLEDADYATATSGRD